MMQSTVTVTTAASTYDLTTLANVQAELDLDGASDAILRRYISGASIAASQYCNRVFARETLSEQLLPDRRATRLLHGGVAPLQLARWPLISVASVTENDVLLTEGDDYTVNKSRGQLTRLDANGLPATWPPLEIIVVYDAGYQTIPADVEDAVIRMVTKRYRAKGRDATLRSEEIPGVRSASYWIATGTEAGNITPDVADILDNYRVPIVL